MKFYHHLKWNLFIKIQSKAICVIQWKLNWWKPYQKFCQCKGRSYTFKLYVDIKLRTFQIIFRYYWVECIFLIQKFLWRITKKISQSLIVICFIKKKEISNYELISILLKYHWIKQKNRTCFTVAFCIHLFSSFSKDFVLIKLYR